MLREWVDKNVDVKEAQLFGYRAKLERRQRAPRGRSSPSKNIEQLPPEPKKAIVDYPKPGGIRTVRELFGGTDWTFFFANICVV